MPPELLRLEALGDELVDFDDTAAVLRLCDLLILVDSSPVHLAGALDRPVWVMLPLVPDWRWLMQREDMPWYPRTRLFRQRAVNGATWWHGWLSSCTSSPPRKPYSACFGLPGRHRRWMRARRRRP